jgi:hypothetical protein
MGERRKKAAATPAKLATTKIDAKLLTKSTGLRVTDPESARVVMIVESDTETPCGAECLISSTEVLTCQHVIELATKKKCPPRRSEVRLRLTGVWENPSRQAILKTAADSAVDRMDLAILELVPQPDAVLDVRPIEFVTPQIGPASKAAPFNIRAKSSKSQ